MELSGRTALITGASRGIGAGIAKSFAMAGANLVLAARSAEAMQALSKDLPANGEDIKIVPTDLSKRQDLDALISVCGPIDILVNNAAIKQRFLQCTEWDEEYWRTTFEVGFWAPALLMRELGRGMAQRGRGVILNISSSAGLRARPFLAHYSAVKAAADMVMQTTAMELGRYGVRAVSIAPGAIDTGHHGISDSRALGSPINRIGLPTDIGELAVFLASDRAAFITGAVIPCDGGVNAGEYSRYDPYLPYVQQA